MEFKVERLRFRQIFETTVDVACATFLEGSLPDKWDIFDKVKLEKMFYRTVVSWEYLKNKRPEIMRHHHVCLSLMALLLEFHANRPLAQSGAFLEGICKAMGDDWESAHDNFAILHASSSLSIDLLKVPHEMRIELARLLTATKSTVDMKASRSPDWYETYYQALHEQTLSLSAWYLKYLSIP